MILSSVAAMVLLSTSVTVAEPQAGAGAAETAPPAVSARSGPVEVSVLTYNVRGLPWPAAAGRAKALVAIGRELAELRRQGRGPTVVLIQEGFGDLGPLVALSGYRYWAQGPARGDRAPKVRDRYPRVRYPISGEGWGKLASSGLHVLSDYRFTAVKQVPFNHCAGLDCLANKGAMLVNVAIPGIAGGLDVVNTHMNSKAAAKAPPARTLRAHQLQTDELDGFIKKARTPGAPLLVGGDFNVKNSPDRYYYRAGDRPFVVVSEYCKAGASRCQSGQLLDAAEPWLASQDLHAFAHGGGVSVRPTALGKLFDQGAPNTRLSDHDGLLVSYRLQAEAPIGPLADLR